MSRTLALTTGLIAMLALLPHWAAAAELKSHEVTDDQKVIHFTFKLSAEVQPEVEYFFDGNFYALHLPGLKLTRQQLKVNEIGAPKHLQPFYKNIRLVQGEDEAQIRIYLTKLCSPADPQLMSWDKGIIQVDLLKPLFKLEGETAPAGAEASTPGAAPEQTPDFIPDNKAAGTEPPPSVASEPTPAVNTGADVPAEPTSGTLRTGSPAVAASAAEASVEPAGKTDGAPPSQAAQAAADTAGEYGATPAGELIDGAPATPTKYSRQDGPTEPGPSSSSTGAPAASPGPSYKQFDLASVPASSVEIRALPFRQAILELVAGCGFNVVVADEVDNSEVNLNFTQKELSLKSALDLLCIAYDLTYLVEDDAIVIKAK
jgi:hypothetical protein